MLYYITSNQEKIRVAKKYLDPLGIEFEGKGLGLVEIQSKSIEEIATHKAKQAFETLKQPLFVNDVGWNIPALNGFPGPFMKYIDEWFTTQQFLDLMQNVKDRTIIYKEVFCYIDSTQVKTISEELPGIVLREAHGKEGLSRSLISLRKDQKSITECWQEGINPSDTYDV